MDSGEKAVLTCVVAIIVSAVIFAAEAWVFQYLWNWLIAPTFEITLLTYGQAFGIVFFLNMVRMMFFSSSSSTK